MDLNGQTILGYHFPSLDEPSSDIPVTPSQLEKWLIALPILNTKQSAYQLPKYIQELNRINVSDNYRLNMLEQLRPSVDHIHGTLTKQFRGSNLKLTREHQEARWLLNVLIVEMAIGYKRLLFSLAKKNPGWFNKGQYLLLAQRTLYYLGETICLSYLLSTAVPKEVWKEFNATYLYLQKLGLNKSKLSDTYAYFGIKKGSADQLYKRIIVLSLAAPYSLRSAELEQLYYGLLPWLDGIKFRNTSQLDKPFYLLDLQADEGPQYQKSGSNEGDKHHIDCIELLHNMEKWQDSGDTPKSFAFKGISTKLLAETILRLKGSRHRDEGRLFNQVEQVEVVIGLQNIDVFLDYVRSIISKGNDYQDPRVLGNEDEGADDISWGDPISDNWDALHYSTSSTSVTEAEKQSQQRTKTEFIEDDIGNKVRRHEFDIENESEHGVCLSCNTLHGTGLYIGELMFIRGFDTKVWTLGIIRWMKVINKKLELGLYLLSAHVDQVVVSQDNSEGDISANALWLESKTSENTILLPSAEFSVGDELHLSHRGEEFDVVLKDVVWNSEGFSQFSMTVLLPKIGDEELDDTDEFLIPAWAK